MYHTEDANIQSNCFLCGNTKVFHHKWQERPDDVHCEAFHDIHHAKYGKHTPRNASGGRASWCNGRHRGTVRLRPVRVGYATSAIHVDPLVNVPLALIEPCAVSDQRMAANGSSDTATS